MRESCIAHVPKEKLAILREGYLAICSGHIGAALLLNYFEYWHNIKIDQSERSQRQNQIAEKHGDIGSQDTTLYQFHTAKDLYKGLMGLVSRKSIEDGINVLSDLGFISIHKNPNPRYVFDSTRYFLLHVDIVNGGIRYYQNGNIDITETVTSDYQNGEPGTPKRLNGSPETVTAITEITTEITTEKKEKRKKKGANAPLAPLDISLSKNHKFDFREALLSHNVNPQALDDWLEVRKKKKAVNSRTAYNGFIREVERSGLSVHDVVIICAERGWQGFDADWVKVKQQPWDPPRQKMDFSWMKNQIEETHMRGG